MLHRKYRPQANPEDCENKCKDFLFILPIQHGHIWLSQNDTIVFDGMVKPGVVRFVHPGEHARIHASEPFESAVLRVSPEALDMVAKNNVCIDGSSAVRRIPPVMEARYDIQRLVPLLGTAVEVSGPQQALLASGVAMALAALIVQDRSDQPMTGFEPEQFAAAVDFANARLSRHLDLDEWASAVHLSTHEFARRFQQHTGVAPYTWFLDRRIDRVKKLLKETEMPLVEIAFDAGFCSQSHFTEAFHKRAGTSPRRWRLRQREPGAEARSRLQRMPRSRRKDLEKVS